jgi:hypothetical protein
LTWTGLFDITAVPFEIIVSGQSKIEKNVIFLRSEEIDSLKTAASDVFSRPILNIPESTKECQRF